MYFVFISAFIYAFVFVIGGDHVSILKHIHVCIKWKRRDEQLTLQLEASQKELNKTARLLDALQNDNDDLAEELKEVCTDKKATIFRFISERKEVERQLGSLRTQCTDNNDKIASSKETHDSLVANIHELKHQQREDGEQLKALKETVKEKKGDVEKMTLRLNEFERDSADLRSQKERTTTEGEGTRTLRQR